MKNRRKLCIWLLILGLTLLMLGGCSERELREYVPYAGMNDELYEVFKPKSKNLMEDIAFAGDWVWEDDTHDGLKFSVLQFISDEHCTYVVSKVYVDGIEDTGHTLNWSSVEFNTNAGKTECILLPTEEAKEIAPGQFSLVFACWSPINVETGNTITINDPIIDQIKADGSWSVTAWLGARKSITRTFDYDAVTINGQTYDHVKVELSPISVQVTVSGGRAAEQLDSGSMAVRFKGGKTLNSSEGITLKSTVINAEGEEESCFFFRFPTSVDPKKVKSVYLGDMSFKK